MKSVLEGTCGSKNTGCMTNEQYAFTYWAWRHKLKKHNFDIWKMKYLDRI